MSIAESRRSTLGRKTVFVEAARTPGRYTDSDFPALGLQVSPLLKAVWYVRFKANGREIRKTIGAAADLTYREARAAAESSVLAARNPAADSPVLAAPSDSLASVWTAFLSERRTKKGTPLAATTRADYDKVYRYALAGAKDWPLATTRVAEWVSFLGTVRDKHGDSKALYAANIVSSVYTYLMSLDRLDANPIMKVRLGRRFIAAPPRETYIAVRDLSAFWRGVQRLTRREGREAITVLLMTGLRLNAGLGIEWRHVNLRDGYLLVPPGMEGWKGFTGAFPLSDSVVTLLAARHERRELGAVHAFPSRSTSETPEHLTRIGGALTRACALGCVPRVTAHDLRRTYATVCNLAFDSDLRKVGALLGHNWAVTTGAITSRYIQTELATLRAMANEVAALILELVGEVPLTEETAAKLRRAGLTI